MTDELKIDEKKKTKVEENTPSQKKKECREIMAYIMKKFRVYFPRL